MQAKYLRSTQPVSSQEHPGLDRLALAVSILGIFLAAAYLIFFYCFPGTGLPGL